MANFENIYNLEKIKSFHDSANRMMKEVVPFTDNLGGGLIAPEALVHVEKRIYKKQFPDLVLLQTGIRVNNEGSYNRFIRSLRTATEGGFAYADEVASDKGVLTLSGETSIMEVAEKGIRTFWTDSQVKELALQGVNCANEHVAGVLKKYQEDIDEIGLIGDKRVEGLLNSSVYTTSAASKTVENLNGLELYQEIAEFINEQWTGVNNIMAYMGNVCLVPIDFMNKAMTELLPADTAGNSVRVKTVWSCLTDNFPTVKFMASEKCTRTRKALLMSTSDEALQLRIPVPLEVGEVVRTGSFEYKTDYKYRIAGCDILQKDSGHILTGL